MTYFLHAYGRFLKEVKGAYDGKKKLSHNEKIELWKKGVWYRS